jgi:hypothetical protein
VVWADAFNVMNHPNFASLTDANFGRATQMLNTASLGVRQQAAALVGRSLLCQWREVANGFWSV